MHRAQLKCELMLCVAYITGVQMAVLEPSRTRGATNKRVTHLWSLLLGDCAKLAASLS